MTLENNQAGKDPPLAVSSSKQDPERPTVSQQPYEVTTEHAFLDVLKPIPIIGPSLVLVFRKWGRRGLLLVSGGFVAGAALMTGLFVFSLMPDWIVPKKYTPGATSSPEPPSPPPGNIDVTDFPRDKWPEWLQIYKQNFDRKSDSLLDQNKVPIISILKLKNSLPTATKRFIWRLDIETNHVFQEAEGFRLTDSGLMEPLSLIVGTTSRREFRVSACNKGDTLVAIVLLAKTDLSRNDPAKFQSTTYVPSSSEVSNAHHNRSYPLDPLPVRNCSVFNVGGKPAHN